MVGVRQGDLSSHTCLLKAPTSASEMAGSLVQCERSMASLSGIFNPIASVVPVRLIDGNGVSLAETLQGELLQAVDNSGYGKRLQW